MLIAATYGPVEDIEIFWTVISLAGLIFSCLGTHAAWKDYKFLKENNIRNGRQLVAKGLTLTEAGRAYVQAVFFATGIVAMCLDASPTTDVDLATVIGVLIRWGFLSCAIVLLGKSIYAWYVRVRNMEELREFVDRQSGKDNIYS